MSALPIPKMCTCGAAPIISTIRNLTQKFTFYEMTCVREDCHERRVYKKTTKAGAIRRWNKEHS